MDIIHLNQTSQYAYEFNFTKDYIQCLLLHYFKVSLHVVYYMSLERHGGKLRLDGSTEAHVASVRQ